MTARARRWWHEAIVYQVWPKSFYSGRGTATGDIPGLISKLDYIKSLGANTIWLSPHYASPMIDEGYDISDYNAINPMFGTLADAEQLIKECHDRGLRCLFDLVVNHTSDQHAWFKESRSSRHNPKSDWYIWRPAKHDESGKRMPPNNWSSNFSQSAWTWDETREEYYLHLYCIEQPDLNWTSEDCRKTIYHSAIKFWLDRGLDGFRCDTINMLSKPMNFPDAAILDRHSFIQPASDLYCNGPDIHTYLKEMGQIFKQYDAMTVGELPHTCDVSKVEEYVSLAREELSMVFQFDGVDLGRKATDKFTAVPYKLGQLKGLTSKWQKMMSGHSDSWTTSFIENHDQGRSVSRFADDSLPHQRESAKMMAMYVLCQSGTPFVFQGQELGMTNIPLDWPESDYLDVNTINYLRKIRAEGVSEERIKKQLWPNINRVARDNARTPMQWSDEEHAGFSTSTPWMRVNENYKRINAAQQLDDPDSVFHFWQRMIALRKEHMDLFTYGDFDLHEPCNESVFSFVKTATSGQKALVLLNFSTDDHPVTLPPGLEACMLQKTVSTRHISSHTEGLGAYEGRVVVFSA
ncbi:hypothetical protein CBS101457_003416 [Exobasidium rhododendri]|nr:hypothetical protein CBS101457_003416 [Exobasidium rhododendri]